MFATHPKLMIYLIVTQN